MANPNESEQARKTPLLLLAELGLALATLAAIPLGWVAVAPAALTAGALGVAVARELRRSRTAQGPLVLGRHVERGRRLAIFDAETGLLADWYFSARISEECERARRYGGTFTLVAIEVDRRGTTQVQEDALLGWMRGSKRVTDLACYAGRGRYLMLLPGTDGERASILLQRIDEACPVASALGEYGRDGATAEDLRGGVEGRLGGLRAA
jgi:hypothetical protein